MPSICIFGAGAIGGYLAAKLEAAGVPVTIVARGEHLNAMRRNGLKLLSGGTELNTRPSLVDDPKVAGPQDYLILTLKAHSLEPALPQLLPLIGPKTTIVGAINGVPWWYCHKLEGPYEDRVIRSVDPDGALWRGLPPAQTLGAIVYVAAEIAEPGVIEHSYGDRFTLGEPDGTRSKRALGLADILIGAGMKAPVRPRIRDELWVKLWGNLSFNPVSALTGGTLEAIANDPGTLSVIRSMMQEGRAVGEALGARFAIDLDKRIDGAREVGAHKTSMLQDIERRRPLEIEALLGAVVEMAEWVDVPMPIGRTILGLVRQRDRLSRAA